LQQNFNFESGNLNKLNLIIMTATLEKRENASLWSRFCSWITSTENRLYIGWFGVLMMCGGN